VAETTMKNTTIFWIHQLRFAQANLDFLEYSKGQATSTNSDPHSDKNSEITNATV